MQRAAQPALVSVRLASSTAEVEPYAALGCFRAQASSCSRTNAMGLFNFGRDHGKTPKTPVKAGAETANASELAQMLRDLGITIQAGQITVKGETVTITGTADSIAEKEKAVLVLGNVKGVAHVDDQIRVVAPAQPQAQAQAQPQAAPAVQAQAAASQFYTVQSGDTLSKIAKQFYGDANRYSAIFEANKPMLKDPDEIYPGQVLRIPQQH
jgi:nucleoid-associated protein YgaU